jgi:hypothetical protein
MSPPEYIAVGFVTVAFCGYSYALVMFGQAMGRSEHNHRERIPPVEPKIELTADDEKVVRLLRKRKW